MKSRGRQVARKCDECGVEYMALVYLMKKWIRGFCSRKCRQDNLKSNPTRTRHGHASKKATSPTFRSWQGMLARCTNPNEPAYPRYGGRGIKVCERWRSFESFLEDMGERPPGTSIDRLDVNGDYVPDNCRWSTNVQQSRNQRRTVLCELSAVLIRELRRRGHKTQVIAEAFGVPRSTVSAVFGRSRTSWLNALSFATLESL